MVGHSMSMSHLLGEATGADGFDAATEFENAMTDAGKADVRPLVRGRTG